MNKRFVVKPKRVENYLSNGGSGIHMFLSSCEKRELKFFNVKFCSRTLSAKYKDLCGTYWLADLFSEQK